MENNLQETIDLLKSTREGFIITEDLKILNHINSSIKELGQRQEETEKKQKQEMKKLEEEIQTTEFEIDGLEEKIQSIDEELKQYADKEQIFSEYANKIEILQNGNLEMKKEIEDHINQIIDINDGKDVFSNSNLDSEEEDVNGEAKEDDKSKQNVNTELDDEKLMDPAVRANLLKLKLYRSLGVVIDSNTNQVFIEHGDSGVDVLSLDDDYSEFYKTKFIWDRLSKLVTAEDAEDADE